MRRHQVGQAEPTEERLADLVARSRDGDRKAWGELWLALAPLVERVAGRWRYAGRLSQCEDARRDILVGVMGELHADGFRCLADLGERLARRDGSYRGWLFRVARNVAVSLVREHAEFLGAAKGGGKSWARHVPLTEAPEEACEPPNREVEGRDILARSRDMLDPAQRDALGLWLQGDDFAEIAAALHEDEGAAGAALLVRSAVKRLRRRWAAIERGPDV